MKNRIVVSPPPINTQLKIQKEVISQDKGSGLTTQFSTPRTLSKIRLETGSHSKNKLRKIGCNQLFKEAHCNVKGETYLTKNRPSYLSPRKSSIEGKNSELTTKVSPPQGMRHVYNESRLQIQRVMTINVYNEMSDLTKNILEIQGQEEELMTKSISRIEKIPQLSREMLKESTDTLMGFVKAI